MAGRELGIWLQQQRTSDRFVQKPAQLQVVRRKCQFVAITPGGKEKTEMYTQHSGFLWGFLKDWFLSRLTPSADGTGILWIPGGYRAKQSSAAPVSTGEPVEPQTVIRDSKRLQGPKKETQQTSQTEILYPQAQKDTSLLLVWKAPGISPPGWLVTVFPCTVTGRGGWFFKWANYDKAVTKYTRKQGIMAQSKEWNKS